MKAAINYNIWFSAYGQPISAERKGLSGWLKGKGKLKRNFRESFQNPAVWIPEAF